MQWVGDGIDDNDYGLFGLFKFYLIGLFFGCNLVCVSLGDMVDMGNILF